MGAFPFSNGSWAAGTNQASDGPRFVRFRRLNGPGEESLDLHTCTRFTVARRLAPDSPILDQTSVVIYYLTPDHRGIMGLGGARQVQHGGEGYVEVHPIQIARDHHLYGLAVPAELEQYREFLDLSVPDAIATWEKSRRSAPQSAAGPALLPRGDAEISIQPDLGTANPPPPDATTGPSPRTQDDERRTMVRDQVFISYSHKDQRFLNDLLTHLKPYLRKGTFTAWSDKQIKPGSQWFDEIKAALTKTSVAVMLVSPDFLDSDFIHEHELGPLLKEAAAGGVTILWVLIRDCSYEETLLEPYQAVVPPDKSLASMPKAKRDTAWKAVCKAIKQAVNRP
jgi:TIR domain-containing protein